MNAWAEAQGPRLEEGHSDAIKTVLEVEKCWQATPDAQFKMLS